MTTPNKPLKGISKIADYGDTVAYRIECECTDDDHSVTAFIEIDNPWDDDLDGYRTPAEIQVEFFVNTTTPYWSKGNGIATYNYENSLEAIWRVTKNRVKAAYDILVKGSTPQSHTLILDEEATRNVANAMLDTIDELKKRNSDK